MPELIPPFSTLTDWDATSWDEINRFGQKYVLPHPEDYDHLLHVTKTVPLDSPVSKSIVFEIVDICHTDWGDDNAFVWMPKEDLLPPIYTSPDNAFIYTSSAIKTSLGTGGDIYNSFPADLKNVWKTINYKYLSEIKTGHTFGGASPAPSSAKLVIPCIAELNCASDISGTSAYKNGADYYEEGDAFKVFTSPSKYSLLRHKYANTVQEWQTRSPGQRGNGTDHWTLSISKRGDPGLSGTNWGLYICPCFAV